MLSWSDECKAACRLNRMMPVPRRTPALRALLIIVRHEQGDEPEMQCKMSATQIYSVHVQIRARQSSIESIHDCSSGLILTTTSRTLVLPIAFLISRSTVCSTWPASTSESVRGRTSWTSTSNEGPEARMRTSVTARIGRVASAVTVSCFLSSSSSVRESVDVCWWCECRGARGGKDGSRRLASTAYIFCGSSVSVTWSAGKERSFQQKTMSTRRTQTCHDSPVNSFRAVRPTPAPCFKIMADTSSPPRGSRTG